MGFVIYTFIWNNFKWNINRNKCYEPEMEEEAEGMNSGSGIPVNLWTMCQMARS